MSDKKKITKENLKDNQELVWKCITRGAPTSPCAIRIIDQSIFEYKESRALDILQRQGTEIRCTLTNKLLAYSPPPLSSITNPWMLLKQCLYLLEACATIYVGENYHYVPYYACFIEYPYVRMKENPLDTKHGTMLFNFIEGLETLLAANRCKKSVTIQFILNCAHIIMKTAICHRLECHFPKELTDLIYEYYNITF